MVLANVLIICIHPPENIQNGGRPRGDNNKFLYELHSLIPLLLCSGKDKQIINFSILRMQVKYVAPLYVISTSLKT